MTQEKPVSASYHRNNRGGLENQFAANISCHQHPSEPAILYCFTCETTCFCMECFLQGLHKNHEVKNVHKHFTQMKNTKVDEVWYKIKGTLDNLLNDQCKFTNKKRELVEIVSTTKLQL